MGANATLARRFYEEVWNERREATIDAMMAGDMRGKMEDRDVAGPAEFKQARREMLAAFPDLRITVEDVIEQDDKVAVRWSVVGTHAGALAGLPPTNRKFSSRGISWLEFQNGRIVRGWDSWNLGALIANLSEAAKAGHSS